MSAPKSVIIGVCGGSGSGKSTLVQRLNTLLDSPDVLILKMDHYYKDLSHLTQAERDECNFDHPAALDLELLAKHLEELKAGRTIERPTYDFVSHTRTEPPVIVAPARVVIIDGILALHHPKIRPLFHVSVFVDAGDDLRFIRRLKRDIAERGRSLESVIHQYLSSVKEMHDTYVEPQKYLADVIVNWRDYNDQAVQMLRDTIHGILQP